MFNEKRSFSEVISIFQFEPTLKNIYVEGISDVFVIKNYLENTDTQDVNVLEIDSVDFEEEYNNISDADKVLHLVECNKERVCYLASKFESIDVKENNHTLCVVDIDFDMVNNINRVNKYLSYTDYNSMELYLFNEKVFEKIFQQLLHIQKHIDITNFMSTLSDVCRKLFFVHNIMDNKKLPMLGNTRDFSYDKTTHSCILDFDSYLNKVIAKNNLCKEKNEIISLINQQIEKKSSDTRFEMRGHTLMELFYFYCKKIKQIKMDEDEFTNSAFLCMDYNLLKQENLFRKISNL